jgi:hypothetical protein
MLQCFGALVVLTVVAAAVFYFYYTVRLPIQSLVLAPAGAVVVTLAQPPPAGSNPKAWQGMPMAIETKSLGIIRTAACAVLMPATGTASAPIVITSSLGAYAGSGVYVPDPSDRVIISLKW